MIWRRLTNQAMLISRNEPSACHSHARSQSPEWFGFEQVRIFRWYFPLLAGRQRKHFHSQYSNPNIESTAKVPSLDYLSLGSSRIKRREKELDGRRQILRHRMGGRMFLFLNGHVILLLRNSPSVKWHTIHKDDNNSSNMVRGLDKTPIVAHNNIQSTRMNIIIEIRTLTLLGAGAAGGEKAKVVFGLALDLPNFL